MKIACVMMQKNEDELLDKWIKYHSHLFGIENLYLFDNGSTSKKTLDILESYKNTKLNIDLDHATPIDFERKGDIIGSKIKQLEANNNYDFIIPMDCDEFIGTLNGTNNVKCELNDIIKELRLHDNTTDTLLFKGQLFNSPLDKNYFKFRNDRKCFFRSGTFGSIDVGFHWGKSRLSTGEHRTNLVLFHFHNKPFKILKSHAREKLKLRVKSFEKDELERYKGPGVHMTRYFLVTETEYLREFLQDHFTKNSALSNKFIKLGVGWPYESNLNENKELITQIFSEENELGKAFQLSTKKLHKATFGWIDSFSITESEFKIHGWALDEDFNKIQHFRVTTEASIISINPDIKILSRPDVLTQHENGDEYCGFEASVPLQKVLEALNHYAKINLYCATEKDEIGWKLSILD